jgi:hypothetical protein
MLNDHGDAPSAGVHARSLMDLVTRAARRAPGELSAPDRYRVGVIIAVGTPNDAGTAPEAACDAELYRLVLGADSEPLDVGRTTRRWTTAIRRAISLRDGHCTFPGCDRPPSHCDIHHCRPWHDGGPALRRRTTGRVSLPSTGPEQRT